MTPELADKIMTRIIARVEADGGVLHKSSGIEEIIGTCAVAEAEGEIIDIISHDGEKWIHRDGKPLDMGDDRVEAVPPLASPTSAEILELLTHSLSVHRIRLEDFKA